MVRAPDPASELMQLRQTQVIRSLNNNGIGAGNINTGFNNGGTDQHIEALMVEIIHHPFQIPFTHLTMADGYPSLRD